MTTEELEKRLFPKKVVDEVKRIAHGKDDPETVPEQPSHDKSST